MRHSTTASLLVRKMAPGSIPNSFLKPIATAAAATLLSACSVATPPMVSTDGAPLATGQSVSLSAPDETVQQAELFAALSEAFAQRGIAISPSGTYQIEYSITERSAAIGIAHENTTGETVAPEIVSEAREDKRIFRECKARRLRLVLVAYPATGEGEIKRAVGEMDDCGFTPERLDALVGAISDAIAAG